MRARVSHQDSRCARCSAGGSAISASPLSPPRPGCRQARQKRLSRAWCGRCVVDHSRTSRYRRSLRRCFGRRGNPPELNTRLSRDRGRLGPPRHVASACRWSSSALRRSPSARAIAPSAGVRANAAWSPTRFARRAQRLTVRIHRGRVFLASLGGPPFEQQHRCAKRVVSDRRPRDGGRPRPSQ